MADTLDEIACPACGKAMKKVYLENENFNVDVCTQGCGGVFFDNREYTKIKKDTSDIRKILEELEGKNFPEVKQTETRKCPVCGSRMVKNFSSLSNRIQIDVCYNCGGVFLDNNELQEIRKTYKSDKELEEALRERAKQTFEILKGKLKTK